MAIVIEGLEKIYRVKRGADVRALKGVTFNLPDRGMVFILGKSGCGKSTLLNVLGGLDGFDKGDVKIDGQSIKDYKAKDLDRHRNNYVGFVFQENNLLETESVQRNVGLALDLQSSKDSDGRVATALESVGLKELAKQKCNRISGGQKQRVAIARALIKQPKLLLCDEPTGALDSETGEEIFCLLKELSGDRLVVVVSHDRESAEKYGDRVIELKDGQIISDSSPLEQQSEKANENEQTEKKKRGGLRFARAYITGVSYIIARPIRMAICLLLCLITFTCAGVIDTIYAYDRDKAMLYTMDKMGSKCYAFARAVKFDNDTYELEKYTMPKWDADELASLLDVDRCDYIYYVDNYALFLTPNIGDLPKELVGGKYYCVNGYVEADESFAEDYGFNLVAGRFAKTTGEVVLPLFLFNFFKTYGYVDGGNLVKINTYDDLIGREIRFATHKATIPLTLTGIIDTNFIFEKQAEVLFGGAPVYGKNGADFRSDMQAIDMDMIHNTMFVCNGFYNYFTTEYTNEYNSDATVLRVLAPYKGSDAQKLKNIRIYATQYNGQPVGGDEQDGTCYHLVNYCGDRICNAEDTFNRIKNYAAYAVAVLVTVSALFIFYYASGTISDKRREIGILRALGASRRDVVKIFACEHGTFAAGAIVISLIIGAILTTLLDNSFTQAYGLGTAFISFGIRQISVVVAVAAFAVVVGVAVPLIKLLIKKPVDVIADRK